MGRRFVRSFPDWIRYRGTFSFLSSDRRLQEREQSRRRRRPESEAEPDASRGARARPKSDRSAAAAAAAAAAPASSGLGHNRYPRRSSSDEADWFRIDPRSAARSFIVVSVSTPAAIAVARAKWREFRRKRQNGSAHTGL